MTTAFDYDQSDRVVRTSVYNGRSTKAADLESRMQYTYTQSGKVGTLSYQEKGGDIRTITDGNGKVRTYTYNDYGEVVKAEEAYTDGTKTVYEYTYDAGGNITQEKVSTTTKNGSVSQTSHEYTYDDTWKDKLKSYDGLDIEYDMFGCPLNYMGAAMTWDVNGNLTAVNKPGSDIRYEYQADGTRSRKTVNGQGTVYCYNKGLLLSETTADERLEYYYDSQGQVVSVTFHKGNETERSYFFTRNMQGDIVGVYRSSDSVLIGTYEYDLWGRPVSVKEATAGIDTDGILAKNPFRYRGYYYDSETGFYCLNARYYDPALRRFLNADTVGLLMVATTSVGCKNLFSYSENNPVMYMDRTGAIIETIFDVVTLGFSIADVINNPKDPWAWAGLAGDVIDLIPCVTGVGEGVKGARAAVKLGSKYGDDVAEAAVKGARTLGKNADEVVDAVGDGVRRLSKSSKPNQIHHFATNKSKKYTSQFENIIKKYGLDLDGDWNKALMPHQGRHPNAYHDYILENLQMFDDIAQGDTSKFLGLFKEMKQFIIDNPEMLYKDYWN